MASESLPTRRKGRIGHSKSKNGCLTCKIRRVKCGEEKPQCYRCTSTGRKCDYKLATSHDFRSWSRDSESDPLLTMGLDLPISLDCSFELRAFEYFFTRGIPIFSGSLNARFWTTCVLQACHTEPIIWDAVISLSALFEHPQYSDDPVRGLVGGPRDSVRAPVKDHAHQQALTWYNRSLSKLRASLESGTANSAVALISCILYICIEILQDNVTEVLQLYHRGVDIISSCNLFSLEESITPLFYNFGALAIIMGYITPDRALAPKVTPPEHFSNLEEAEFTMYCFITRIISQERVSAKTLVAEGRMDEHRMAELKEQKDFLWNLLCRWYQNLQALGITLEGEASQAQKLALAKLLQAYATLRVIISTSTTVSEMANDDLLDDFDDILRYGRYSIKATRYPDGTQPPFSLESNISLPLFICATKCRNYRIRHDALELLREAPKVQGLCKSTPYALMASKIIGIEEDGLELVDRGDGTEPIMFVPESQRISNVAIIAEKKEVEGHWWALRFTRIVSNGAGDYQNVEEVASFDASDYLPSERSSPAGSLKKPSEGIASRLRPLEGSVNPLVSMEIRQLLVSTSTSCA